MKLTLNPEISYITCFAAAGHLSQDDHAVLAEKAGDVFYIHATAKTAPGYVLRFGAACGYDTNELCSELADLGFSADIQALCVALHGAGYDAVHFDADADLLPGVPFFTDDNSKIMPVAYDLPVLYWHDLDDAQKAVAISDACADAHSADDYFTRENAQFVYLPAGDNNDAQLYNLADFMRLSGSLADDWGFTGYTTETAFSAMLIKISGDGETATLARVAG